ncbi:invasion associated locus B family protein [Paracoccus salsus]|uniref:invasion associated locus B family protein n=1 Tax=Paracoccus salsus TaxID=2911061 RepID=UPI001F440325|nr:invasion associated locus B family protein [Paracoccus salsus]MCF3974495.1 invasion associated locus B family protein [Paracoccus salsus]
MPIKPSQALLAALAFIAAPAFAQDTDPAAPSGESETSTQQPVATEAAPDASAEDGAAANTAAPAEDTAAPAEDTAAPAAEQTPEAETEDEAAAPAPEETASDEPAIGSYYVKSTDQDWTTRCIRTDEIKDPCELYQLMKDSEGNSVAELTLIPLANGDVAAGATLVAPLETDLVEGLGFAVDSGKPRGYPFSFCAPVGCVSRMGFTKAELTGLKRGAKATVTLLPFGGDPKKPVELTLSLSGFTASFDALSEYAAAQPAPAAEAEPASE